MGDNYDNVVEKFYYSITVPNNSQEVKEAVFNTTTTQPLLKHTENWECSVVNFDIPSTNVPLFVFEDASVAPDYSLGYWVTVQNSAGVTNSSPVLNDPVQIHSYTFGIDADPPYKNYIFDYNLFVEQVNNAIVTAWQLTFPKDLTFPFITYESPSSLFNFYWNSKSPEILFTGLNFGLSTKIYFNNRLYKFFQFNSIFNNPPIFEFDVGPLDYLINFYNPKILRAPSIYNDTTNLLWIEQPYETLGLWSQYNKILFVSTSMPIASEQLSDFDNTGMNRSLPVLLTFDIPNDQKKDASNYIYQPQGGFKWISMTKSQTLQQFDINIQIQGKTSSDVIPIFISPGESFSFKMCFRLKSKLVRMKK